MSNVKNKCVVSLYRKALIIIILSVLSLLVILLYIYQLEFSYDSSYSLCVVSHNSNMTVWVDATNGKYKYELQYPDSYELDIITLTNGMTYSIYHINSTIMCTVTDESNYDHATSDIVLQLKLEMEPFAITICEHVVCKEWHSTYKHKDLKLFTELFSGRILYTESSIGKTMFVNYTKGIQNPTNVFSLPIDEKECVPTKHYD